MKLIDKYILSELLGPFLFAVAAFVGIFLGTGPAFRIAEMLSKYQAPWTLAFKLIAYALPVAVYPMLPIALLLATLLTFGKLSSSSEITVMKSGGIRFARIMLPVIMFSLAVSLVSFIVAQYLMPLSNEKYDNIVKYEIQSVATPRSYQQNLVLRGGFGVIENGYTVLFAGEYDPDTQRLKSITLDEFDKDKNLVGIITSEWADFKDYAWTFHNGHGYAFDALTKKERILSFEEQIFPLERPPEKTETIQKKREQMNIGELRQVIDLLQREAEKTGKADTKKEYKELESELYNRSALPFSCFVFVLIGAPLGMQSNRSSSSVGLGLSLVIILIYFALYALMLTIAGLGALPAALAAWAPNILGFLIGVTLVLRQNAK